MADLFIKFTNVSKSYGTDASQVSALKNVSFEIGEGEFCILLGASGAGKTTLLNMLGGMDDISSGEILFDGKMISDLNRKQLIEYRRFDVEFVFQFYNLIPNLTTKENVEIAAMLCKEPAIKTQPMGKTSRSMDAHGKVGCLQCTN